MFSSIFNTVANQLGQFISNSQDTQQSDPMETVIPTQAPEANDNNNGLTPSEPFEPSVADVVVVQCMLLCKNFREGQNEEGRLPPEIVDEIIDMAEYWPHSTVELSEGLAVPGGPSTENHFLLRTRPLGFLQRDTLPATTPLLPLAHQQTIPVSDFQSHITSRWGFDSALAHPCRKIVFDFASHDQGWGGNQADRGTHRHSYTWFEAGLERFDGGADPEAMARVREQLKRQEEERQAQIRNRPPLFQRMRRLRVRGFPIMAAPVPLPVEQVGEPSTGAGPADEKEKDAARETEPEPKAEEGVFNVGNLRSIIPRVEEPAATPPPDAEAEGGNSTSPAPTPVPDSDATQQPTPPKFVHPLFAEENLMIQSNLQVERRTQDYRIEWRFDDHIRPTDAAAQTELVDRGRGKATGDGAFVRDMRLGDVLTVWGMARFGGWSNHVERFKVKVYWKLPTRV